MTLHEAKASDRENVTAILIEVHRVINYTAKPG